MNTQTPPENSFDSRVALAAERALFRKEWKALWDHPGLRLLAQAENRATLYQIYQQRVADQNPFSLALYPTCWLSNYFAAFLARGLSWPKGALARRVFLRLAAIPLVATDLDLLLSLGLLDHLSGDQLQRLDKVLPANARSLVEYAAAATEGRLSAQYWDLGADLILSMPASELGPGIGRKMYLFLTDILPLFVNRFPEQGNQVYAQERRLIMWFLTWISFVDRKINDLPLEDSYYQLPYAQIIQYVPPYILWNNGMNFGLQMRVYTYHSLEFRHLAVGGSFRNSPDGRYYSRRMARTLVKLSPVFPRDDFNVYLYAFCESLGVEGMLHDQLQAYLRLPQDPAAAKKRMDRWNPIIQKLAQLRLQGLPLEHVVQILGYVYHCVRDQEDFSLQGRGLAWLQGASRAYYHNIERRARLRAERMRQEQAAWDAIRKREETSWAPHPEVSPYEWYEGSQRSFRIIELCTRADLAQEGARMGHCVASYEDKCKTMPLSIWSLQQFKKDRWYSLVTIELFGKEIRQAQGRFNVAPSPAEEEKIRLWAAQEDLVWHLYPEDYY